MADVMFPSTRDLSLSDSALATQFEYFGKMALHYRNRVIGMLPEIARRRIYLQHGCSSVYEYAKKTAGLSEEQVALALNIRERLQDKPALKQLFDEGAVSINKLSRVMSIATKENEEELAEKVQLLSLGALKTLVRDVKCEIDQESSEARFLVDHKTEIESRISQENESEFGFTQEVVRKLHALKEKGIDINEALIEFLDQREAEIVNQKEEIAESLPSESGRYIPARVRRILKKEHGAKCAQDSCTKPWMNIHHTARYALTKSHNPNYLAPLCKQHHEIAHAIDLKVQRGRLK